MEFVHSIFLDLQHVASFIFSQYHNIPTYQIVLELIAVTLGLISVACATKQSVLVFPIGIVATSSYVYVLFVKQIWGQMLVHAYYTMVSIYGWYVWLQKDTKHNTILKITWGSPYEWAIGLTIFITGLIVLPIVYYITPLIGTKNFVWTLSEFNFNINNYLDILTTSIGFIAMFFMARKIIANWLLWIVGNILILPMFWSDRMYFSVLNFFLLTLLAIWSYIEWKPHLSKK